MTSIIWMIYISGLGTLQPITYDLTFDNQKTCEAKIKDWKATGYVKEAPGYNLICWPAPQK